MFSTSDVDERVKALNTPPYVLPNHKLIKAPPMVYISGEEMTNYTMKLILDQWIRPHLDISDWQFYDLSCISRDATNDKVGSDESFEAQNINLFSIHRS